MERSRTYNIQSTVTHLIKKYLSFPENMFQFSQFQEISFQSFSIMIHFSEFVFQFLKGRLKNKLKSVRSIPENL